MNVPSTFYDGLRDFAGIRVIDLRSPSWETDLYASLRPPFTLSRTGKYKGEKPLAEILRLSRNELQAHTAIIEPYISTDWSEEYGAIYSRTFRDMKREATRIHFFRDTISEPDIYSMSDSLRTGYLGYCVVRPLEAFRVGDTVLSSPCRINHTMTDRVHCQAPFSVSVLSNRLRVTGMPFIQQDTTVGVCAEANLWMVARLMNRFGETGRFRPAQVTTLATSVTTSGPPREGLNDQQIMTGLRAMRLNPVCLYPANPDESKSFIYTCIESGIPVIAGIPEHVVVVIGHYYHSPLRFSSDPSGISDAVSAFIAHDDARGPYMKMDVGILTVGPEHDSVDLLTIDGKPVDVCFAPLPERVHMAWDDVTATTKIWISHIKEFVSTEMGIPPEELWEDSELDGLITRTYLRRSSDFKRDIQSTSVAPHRAPDIVAQYLCLPMPKYIWVVELGRIEHFEGVAPTDRLICGEILLDSTGNRHVPEHTLLAFHLNGMLYTPEPPVQFGECDDSQLIVVDHQPYKPLLENCSPDLN